MARAALSLFSHTMLVVSPAHAQTFGHEGWSRETLASISSSGSAAPAMVRIQFPGP